MIVQKKRSEKLCTTTNRSGEGCRSKQKQKSTTVDKTKSMIALFIFYKNNSFFFLVDCCVVGGLCDLSLSLSLSSAFWILPFSSLLIVICRADAFLFTNVTWLVCALVSCVFTRPENSHWQTRACTLSMPIGTRAHDSWTNTHETCAHTHLCTT